MFFYGYNSLAAVHLECDGRGIEDISVSRTLLDDLIIAVREFIRHHELARYIGVIGVDVNRRRVADMLHDILARVGIAHLKANTRRRDNFARFRILFDNLNERLKGCVVYEEAIGFAVFLNKDIERCK